MGYFLATSLDWPSARTHASPKTHVPGSRLQERGHRFYSTELSRWVNRDPLGETGGLHPYGFVLNDSLNKWDLLGAMWHYQREGKPRATVWFDAFGDTVQDLAKVVQLDETQVSRWIKDEQGNGVSNPKMCELYTVPNVALVVVGTSRGTLDPSGLVSRPYLIVNSVAVFNAFEAKGFHTVLLDAAYGGLSSDTLQRYRNDDLWGMALFGHGKAGQLVLKVGFFPFIIEDQISAPLMNPMHGLGAVVVYFCHAEQGTWSDLVSPNGKFRGTSGFVNIALGPLALTPSHWGSWSSLIDQMTPP